MKLRPDLLRAFGWILVLGLLLPASAAPTVRADDKAKEASEASSSDSSASDANPTASEPDDAARRKAEQEQLELMRLFADTFAQIRSNYVQDVSDRELMEAAIRGMVTKLDPFSDFIPPTDLDRFKSGVENEFGGIGIQVSTEKGELEVTSPLVGTPAYKAGIISGDIITEIDGTTTKGISIDEAVRLMKGPIGTDVKVRVRRDGREGTELLTIKRATIRVETILGDHRNDDDGWSYFLDEEKKIGYIRLISFGRHTASELERVLKQLKKSGMTSLVLDLRFNPGGLLSSAIEVCDLFIQSGRIVSTSGRNVTERTWDAHEAGTFADFPMAVLVNGFSASASEIVSACLQDHGRAVVVGERTFGKGSVQNIIDLEDGRSALKLTTAGYLRPSGKNIHRFPGAKEDEEWGVTPNEGYGVPLPREELTELLKARRLRDAVRKRGTDVDDEEAKAVDNDKQIQLALKFLDQKLAASAADNKTAKSNKTAVAETPSSSDSDPKADDKPKSPAKKSKADRKPEPKVDAEPTVDETPKSDDPSKKEDATDKDDADAGRDADQE